MALPSTYRLKRRQEFDCLYRHGKRVTARYFVLRALPPSPSLKSGQRKSDSDVAPSRFGVAVSLKVSKRAVVRNRIRRQVHAAIRQLLPQIPDGWLILVSARTAASECDYWQFLRELEQLLTRAEVIHGHSGRGVF
ncbi:MAG: ribonuclease P protein component [Elainellaceae cyanobacterium]